jgi:hypothetical protein
MNPDWLVPLVFLSAFLALWIGVNFHIAAMGGWRQLAKYAGTARYAGPR